MNENENLLIAKARIAVSYLSCLRENDTEEKKNRIAQFVREGAEHPSFEKWIYSSSLNSFQLNFAFSIMEEKK